MSNDFVSPKVNAIIYEDSKGHSEGGVHFLTDTSAAPTGVYYGFIVTDATTTITSITYIDSTKQTGDLTAMTLVQGMYFTIPGGFSTITLGAGNMVLLKSS